MENYENKDRDRYYGIRCGDVVRLWSPLKCGAFIYSKAVVLGMVNYDERTVFIDVTDYGICEYLADWCDVIQKVEDRGQIHAPAY